MKTLTQITLENAIDLDEEIVTYAYQPRRDGRTIFEITTCDDEGRVTCDRLFDLDTKQFVDVVDVIPAPPANHCRVMSAAEYSHWACLLTNHGFVRTYARWERAGKGIDYISFAEWTRDEDVIDFYIR